MTFDFFTPNNENIMLKLLEHIASAFKTPTDAKSLMLKLKEYKTFAFYTLNNEKSNVEAIGTSDVCLLHTKQ